MSHSIDNVNETPHFTYIWTIENMCEPCLVESPTFTVNQMEMTKWCLAISAGHSDCIELFVSRCEDDGPNAIEIKVELSFLGKDGLPIIEDEGIKKFTKEENLEFEEFEGKDEVFFRRREEFMPKDELTIRCRMWRTRTEISQMDSCFARTRLRPHRHTFVWAIREFSTLQRDHEMKVLLSHCPDIELTFKLHVTKNNGEEHLSIRTKTSGEFWAALKICLLDFEGTVVHAVEKIVDCTEYLQFENFFATRKLISDALSLLHNDVLVLRCGIEMEALTVWRKIENYSHVKTKSCPVCASDKGEDVHLVQQHASNAASSFSEDMKSLIEENTLSDVILQTGTRKFPAHKCILSARSPVFADLFRRDTKENCIEIPDVDEDTLRELLSYIYTDGVGELGWRRAIDLYRAADKYKLLDLKSKCATCLKSDLTLSSVCAVLDVADKHRDTELREAAQDFVMQQGTECFTSDAWRRFKKDNSELAFDILEQILCNMRKKPAFIDHVLKDQSEF